MDGIPVWKSYMQKVLGQSGSELQQLFRSSQFYNESLHRYVHEYDSDDKESLIKWFNEIPLADK